MTRKLTFFALFLALPLSGATLTHDYNLTSSLNDLVGSAPLNGDGGAVTALGYSFLAQQGLNVSSVLTNVGDYSILMDFSFQDLSNFRKILDFKNLASDDGLYNLNTDLNYFSFSFGPSGSFSPDTPARVVITRDAATKQVVGYVNGVEDVSFTDTTGDATFTGANAILRFFEDDNVTGARESSAGRATRISIYDGALTSTEAAVLGDPQGSSAPEPTSLVLMGIGMVGLVLTGRRLAITTNFHSFQSHLSPIPAFPQKQSATFLVYGAQSHSRFAVPRAPAPRRTAG
jgi:hypothetical protein